MLIKLEFYRECFETKNNFLFNVSPTGGSELYHAKDGQADVTMLIVNFRNFAIAPRKRVKDVNYRT
jgi:hypothetical protein